MEVDQQPHFQVQQAKIRKQLSLVYRMNRLLALDLDDYQSIYDEIGPKAAVKFHTLVDERAGFWR